MTIARRLYLFAVMGVFGLLVLGGIGLYQLSRFSNEASANLDEIAAGIDDMVDLKAAHVAFKTQVQEWKNILIRGNRQEDFDKYLKQFGNEEAKVQELLAKSVKDMRARGEDDKFIADIEALAKEHQALGIKYREALKLFDGADREAGRKVDQAVKGVDRATATGMDTLVAKFEADEVAHLRHQKEQLNEDFLASRNMLIGIVLFVALAASIAVFRIVHGIRGSLDAMKHGVEEIPKTWDLRLRVPISGNDEIAQTGRSINLLLENFHDVVGRIIANAQQTANSCGTMAASLREIEHAISQQHDATSAMAAAVEELTTSFAQIHSNANDSLTATGEATQSALSGDRVIGEASAAMSSIVGSVQGAASVIERVGSQSNDISAIVQVIREVADQTNLLALNAAIEAARAGEQGRGFAVVADEVRKLAEKTTSSAEEIKRMIDTVQQSSGEAVSDIRRVVGQVQIISEKSARAQAAIEDIRSHTQKSETFSRDITYALGEQSSASTLIAQNVETVARMSEENANNVSRAEVAMRDLETESRTLQEAVARFTI
ncbi:MAG: methyl-accepting chemotaxis protein [Pseudomonadota bacterium]